ncbi:hypothetical protein [Schaalia vaccimaxillae]|uniref:hypothetical protein n=1 Tax=Schaalia vaccimaxillae TaxID=183916 RepID=UPI0003B46B5D|nr:hypothetical protein [Schaalia vaccimaxillae]
MTRFDRFEASSHLRSAVFAFFFAPLALVLMGSSMADVQTMTALGQPLASVEGLVGMALASILLALVSISSDRSPAGMIVTFLASIVVGALQLSGRLTVPFLMASVVDRPDMSASMSWNLYPVIVVGIMAGATCAFILTLRDAPARQVHSLKRLRSHPHAWVASLALPLALIAMMLLIHVAPTDTTAVAAQGLSGVIAERVLEPIFPLIVTVLLAAVAFVARWSLTGPQLAAWLVLVLPSYLFQPLWSSLTGHVVTPGASLSTQVAMAAPVATSLGLALATSTIGLFWARIGDDEGEDASAVMNQSPSDPRIAGD